MNVEEIREFARLMGCAKISVGRRWVSSTCPMGHRHNGGKDDQPSFAISIDPDDESNCRCLACGISGPLIPLVWRMEAEGKGVRPDLFEHLIRHNQIDAEKFYSGESSGSVSGDLEGQIREARKWSSPVGESSRKSRFVRSEEPQAEVPEHILCRMIADMSPDVLDYLTRRADPLLGIRGRGLSRKTVRAWELGWHRFVRRIAIPIRDESGKLVSISGRVFDDTVCAYCRGSVSGKECVQCGRKQPRKYLHSPFKRDRVLYGEHKRDPTVRSGYLSEGFFQTMAIGQSGYANALAPMGAYLSWQQAEKLVGWFDHLVIVPDGDRVGRDAAKRYQRDLGSMSVGGNNGRSHRIEQIDVVEMPDKKDADSIDPDVLCDLLGPPNIG